MTDIDIDDILSFPYVTVEYKNDDCRIYYDKNIYPNSEPDKKFGFYFWVIEVLSYKEVQYCSDSELRILFYGYARYDGFDKIYLGDKEINGNEGIGDPNIGILIKVLEELKKMEKQYCETTFYE